MRRMLQAGLGLFGYELRRKPAQPPPDPFTVQRQLIAHAQPIIFDVGAYIGLVTQTYRKLFPEALIYAFEPFPDSAALLKQRTAQDQRTAVYAMAIADQEAVIALNCNESSMTHSLLPTDKRGGSYWGEGVLETKRQIKVVATTIDAFCHEHGIATIEILKLDIQGAEYTALLGAQTMLARQAIGLLYLELLLAPTYAGQHQLYEYLHLLDALGYTLLNFYNSIHSAERIVQADAIFVSNALLS